jgi:hypothetical protein
MNFKKVNNITGWAIFLIALATYFLTREARGSLWDTGEFIASAKGVQLPHPPGAPLFVLLGRFFIILFGDNGHSAASAVNFMSALASAATILFLFWSVTHFARKMFVNVGEQLNASQTFTTMAAGAVGALAYTFSDSFWFSAVEGEVYALSSFFTALVFWSMLKWEHADEHAGNDLHARARSDRWIVFLFFMMGLSIGVHLLNILTIPAIVMIYYYRRYRPSTKGAILAFLIGCIITGLVQFVVIQYSMKAAGQFDVFFVNSLGLPFFSGFAFYFIALFALIIWALRFNEKKTSQVKLITWFVLFLFLSALPFVIVPGVGIKVFRLLLLLAAAGAIGYFIKLSALRIIKLSLWCYAFMMIGYFMYFTALIRSNANPAIDMNNVDNPINLVYYLSREQYGEAPLLYGPHFAAKVPDDINREEPFVYGEMKYVKGEKKYIQAGRKKEYNFNSDVKQIFPRVWDASNDQNHANFYADWLDLRDESGEYVAPGMKDNIDWFLSYQMSHMYWRYFMWNFAGKQNDNQGFGNKRDGNWITGFSFIDNQRLGNQSMMPDSIKNNKAHNKLFLLPFLLGMLGCIYQFLKKRNDWIVSFLLFFMTGIAVVLYLNQPGNQPRERDYAFVGSFFAFAIWIGLAVVAFVKMAKEKADKLTLQNMLIGGSILTFFITFMSSFPGPGGAALMTSIFATVLYAAVAAGITYLLRAISSGGQNERTLNLTATVICLAVPLLMAQQEWDDHDRSKKTTGPDIAKAYLESCAPNAIIFTFGDNDTYPLWYAQEVEGIRPDIRVINNSLLGIDWYINQLRYKINNADSLDVVFSPQEIEGETRAYIPIQADSRINQSYYNDIDTALREFKKPAYIDNFPVRRFSVKVDKELVIKNGTVNPTDTVLAALNFEIPANKNYVYRSDLAILAILATTDWKRPIYFTSPFDELGFGKYLRKDGMAYRLVPVEPKHPEANWISDMALGRLGGTNIRENNTDTMFNNLMTKYEFGGANKKGVYFDEENRRHILNLRALYAEAAGNLADAGRKEDAVKLLDMAEKGILPENMPYALVSRYNSHNQTAMLYLEACYKAGKAALAEKVRLGLRKDLEQQQKYYAYIRDSRSELYGGYERSEAPINEIMLQVLDQVEKKYAPEVQVKTTIETPTTITNTAKPDSAVKTDSGKKPK